MPLTIQNNLSGALQEAVHRFARLWKITRTDNEQLYLTDHNAALVFEDGITYTPIGSGRASAHRREGGLNDANWEYESVINSSAITAEDLYAGRYREAKIVEYTIDWRVPWAGAFRSFTYYITEVEFNGETWVAQVTSIPAFLRQIAGRSFGRNCRKELFSTECGANRGTFSGYGTVNSITTQRTAFIMAAGGVFDATAGYYDDGELVWLTGANAGVRSPVKTYNGNTISPNYLFQLQLETPFDIAIGDMFTLTPSCDGLSTTCKNKFNNIANYYGFEDMPGADGLIGNPDN